MKAGLNGLSWSTKEVDGGAMSYEVHATLTGNYFIRGRDDMLISITSINGYAGFALECVDPYNGFSGFSVPYGNMKNAEGKSLLDESGLSPGEYSGESRGVTVTVKIGDNNTASWEEIRKNNLSGFLRIYNAEDGGRWMTGQTTLLASKNEEHDDSVAVDKINNIPCFTIHRAETEEVIERTPIYNTIDPPVTDGSAKNLWIQSGAEVGDGMFMTLSYMDTNILGINGVDVSTEDGASNAIDLIGTAVDKISSMRSSLGAQQNRLEHTYKNVTNISENTQAAESRIRDTDMAKEMVELSKHNILEQAGTTMIAQANQTNQGVLNLLQ